MSEPKTGLIPVLLTRMSSEPNSDTARSTAPERASASAALPANATTFSAVPQSGQLGCGGLEGLRLAGCDQDVGTASEEFGGDSFADSATCAGDDGGTAFEVARTSAVFASHVPNVSGLTRCWSERPSGHGKIGSSCVCSQALFTRIRRFS